MSARKPKRAGRVDYAAVRRAALRLPGVTEGTSYGTPALKVKGKLFARLKEDRETLVLRCGAFDRAHLLETHPDIFFLTDHYRDYPWILVRLATLPADGVPALLAESWRQVAPKKLIAEHEGRG